MKRIILSMIALTVCALLTASVLCACGNESQTNNSGAADTPAATAAEAATDAANAPVDETAAAEETAAAADSANTSDSALVGSWEYEYGEFVYTFNTNGTGTYDAAGTVMEFTYTDHGDSVELLYTGNTLASTYGYRIEGDTLYIKDSLDNDVKYIKK